MNTLKSGPSSDSADSVLFTVVSCGGAVILRKESKPSDSPKPVIAVSEPATEESPQTERSHHRVRPFRSNDNAQMRAHVCPLTVAGGIHSGRAAEGVQERIATVGFRLGGPIKLRCESVE